MIPFSVAQPVDSIRGQVFLPGDKSISHRVLMFSFLAKGSSQLANLNTGLDVQATQIALANHSPNISTPQVIQCDNSGTTARLFCGLFAKSVGDITLIGDASLSKRPMRRLADCLKPFGVRIETSSAGTFPVHIYKNAVLQAANVSLPVASAQMKSACILAGLQAEGTSVITEPGISRDHTERLLRLFGADIHKKDNVTFVRKSTLHPIAFTVPGDPSSAAFLIVAAIIAKQAKLRIQNMSLNPTRIGFIQVLQKMGANITLYCDDPDAIEPVGRVDVISSPLTGVAVSEAMIPNIIDEIPVLMIAASCATGWTTFDGIAELRLKESDRIASMTQNLKTLGIASESTETRVAVKGGHIQGGQVDSFGDHRIAMSFLVASAASKEAIEVNDTDCIKTSFPEFFELAHTIGLSLSSHSSQSS